MFWSDAEAIPKQNVCTHEIDQRIPVMTEDVLRWPAMGGTYLEDIGCLGAALVGLLGGVMDFNTADGFGMVLETGLTLVPMNVWGLGGEGRWENQLIQTGLSQWCWL